MGNCCTEKPHVRRYAPLEPDPRDQHKNILEEPMEEQANAVEQAPSAWDTSGEDFGKQSQRHLRLLMDPLNLGSLTDTYKCEALRNALANGIYGVKDCREFVTACNKIENRPQKKIRQANLSTHANFICLISDILEKSFEPSNARFDDAFIVDGTTFQLPPDLYELIVTTYCERTRLRTHQDELILAVEKRNLLLKHSEMYDEISEWKLFEPEMNVLLYRKDRIDPKRMTRNFRFPTQ